MAIQVTLAGVPLLLAPEVRIRSDRGSLLVGTITGGAVLWQGGSRQQLRLHGQGLTGSEVAQLEGYLASGATVSLAQGSESWELVVARIERHPTTGSDRWSVEVEAWVIG